MKNIITTFLLLGVVFVSTAQNLNKYKYIIIPETYEFTGETNQYQLNSLTKFLFEQQGFNTLMKTEEKPQDLRQNPCSALKADLADNSGLFVTKLVVKLIDCNDRVVFESQEGRSRVKDFQKAYQEALRNAFAEFEEMEYKFSPESTPEVAERKQEAVTKPQKKPKVETEETLEDTEEIIEIETKDDIAEPAYDSDQKRKFQYAGNNFELRETAQGFGLFQEGASEPIAILIESDGGKSYIYNSLTNQGIAYFDDGNNLIVEYFNRQENKKVKLKYELIN